MTHTTQNHRFSELFHCRVFYKLENMMFRKLDLFAPSVEGKTAAVLAPSGRANFNDWPTVICILLS
jgi:hypothetical protein